MRVIALFIENHRKVMITDKTLVDSVHLSHRYITGRQLSDKSVSVLDTACARLAIGLTTSPATVEEATRCIGQNYGLSLALADLIEFVPGIYPGKVVCVFGWQKMKVGIILHISPPL